MNQSDKQKDVRRRIATVQELLNNADLQATARPFSKDAGTAVTKACAEIREIMRVVNPKERLEELGPKEAFLHVVHDHRYLAAARCNWNLLQTDDETTGHADGHLPNIIEAAQDTVLLHARLLIEFYAERKVPTDISLRDFGLTIEPNLKKKLKSYKRSIEVHLLHLTAWRDTDYRARNAKDKNANAINLDWNEQIPALVELIWDALKYVSEETSKWKPAFSALHDACRKRDQNKCFPWPDYLNGKDNVRRYLESLGL